MTIKERELQLLNRIRNGDKSAYIELVKPYSERLLRKAKSMMKNEDDAEDVVQDSLISGYKSIGNFITYRVPLYGTLNIFYPSPLLRIKVI